MASCHPAPLITCHRPGKVSRQVQASVLFLQVPHLGRAGRQAEIRCCQAPGPLHRHQSLPLYVCSEGEPESLPIHSRTLASQTQTDACWPQGEGKRKQLCQSSESPEATPEGANPASSLSAAAPEAASQIHDSTLSSEPPSTSQHRARWPPAPPGSQPVRGKKEGLPERRA